ncbi:Phosphoesterase [Candidatus Magnetomoraceae bacterium gMMP-15]
MQKKESYTIGVISDTHNLLRPQAVNALHGSDLIIHSGDIANSSVIKELEAIAPVVPVRGNMDYGTWANDLPETEIAEIGGISFYILHDLFRLDLDPAEAGFDVVVNGHTHRPNIKKKNGVLYLNPGSAGPERRGLPVSLALLRVNGKNSDVELINLLG